MRLTSIEHLLVEGADALIHEHAITLSKSYDNLLDNFELENEYDGREPGIHASELNSCKRQVVYTLFNTKKVKTVPSDWRKRFEIGHALHNMVQSHFELMAKRSEGRMTFTREVKVQDTELGRRLHLVSSCDGVFEMFHPGDDLPYLRIGLEIKSEAPDEWAKLKEPRQKHVEQSHLYMKALDLPLVWYLYWNKGNQNYTATRHPFLAKYDPKVWAKLEKRAQECLDSADRNELPDREEGISCRWCPYAYTCEPTTVSSFSRPIMKTSLLNPLRRGR